MGQPDWNDPALDAGVMVRGALWLVQEVGVGRVFTKADIRRAFPEAAQADRRIRDLRDYGWVLHTRSEDASVLQEQTRFVKVGVEVWDPRARSAGSPNKAISSKSRDEVMARDGYMCTVCGIAGGEEYPDDSTQTAVLSVTKFVMASTDGSDRRVLATVCRRCMSGRGSRRVTIDRVVVAAQDLVAADMDELATWMRRGRRAVSGIDYVWALYLSLPAEARDEARSALSLAADT